MNKDFKTLIDNYIKEQEEKLNQKRKDAMLLIFKKFVEEQCGWKIYIEETVGRRKTYLCFTDEHEFQMPDNIHPTYKYDLETGEEVFDDEI